MIKKYYKEIPATLLYVVIFLMIYVSRDTLFFGTNSIKILTFVAQLVTFAWFVIFASMYFSNNWGRRFVNHTVIFMILLVVCVIMSGMVNGLDIWVWIRISTLLCGFFISAVIPRERFLTVFENIMVFIAAFSIIALIIEIVSPSIIQRFPIIVNLSGYRVHNLFFTVIPQDYLFRLFGPFREPGVYIVFLSVAILSHFLRNDKIVIWKLAILIAAQILTLSTTGYIVIAALMLFYLLRNIKSVNRNSIAFVFVFLVALFYLWEKTDFLTLEGDVFSKFDEVGRASTVSRFGSIWGNIQIALENPMFGVGGKLSELFPYYCEKTTGFFSEHNTNTVLIQFATFGVLYGILFFVGFYRFLRYWTSPFLGIFGLICMFLMFSGENLSESLLPYIIIGYGYNSSLLDASKKIVQSNLTHKNVIVVGS